MNLILVVNGTSSNRTFFQFSQKGFDTLCVFYARRRFEAAVEVDACKAGMTEFLDGFCAVGIDAAAEQKRGGTAVAVQQVPVELVARAAVAGCFRIEKIVVAQTVVA